MSKYITIKGEDYSPITLNIDEIMAVMSNVSKTSVIRTLVILKGNAHGYVFSVEEADEILSRIKQAKGIDDEEETSIGLTD